MLDVALIMKIVKRMTANADDLPEWLNQAIDACGKSTEEIAKEANVSKGTIYNLINGSQTGVSWTTLKAIESAVGAKYPLKEAFEIADNDEKTKTKRRKRAKK